MSILPLALLSSLAAAGPLLAQGTAARNDPTEAHTNHEHSAPAKLVEIVRNATRHFVDVNAATAANYQPLFGCVSGPDHGAMGVHYINLSLYGDGEIDASRPEAIIYEPWEGGLRLVGVEYIVDSRHLDGASQCSTDARRPGVSVREQPEPLRLAGLLRTARLGLAGKPQRRFRRLEQASDMRRPIARLP